ncbi:MAG: hypothetical protein M1830_006459 [Pleopsidium flavum]|nr:MAG: hypothetical protein M1830_006459 [Pleopsidium flavum]
MMSDELTSIVYGTTWVGETYYRQDPKKAEELKTSKDVLGDIARRGSLALVLFSLISFGGSIILPWFVKPAEDEGQPSVNSLPEGVTGKTSLFRKYQPDIPMAWALSQVAFGASMILAPFSKSFQFGTTLIAFCGIPWAMNGWAPLAIMGVEINKLESSTDDQAYTRLSQDGALELNQLPNDPHHTPEPLDPTCQSEEPHSSGGEMAGIYLGILNIFATIPQFIATAISWLAFSILEPGKSPELAQDGDDAHQRIAKNGLSGTAVCLAVGAVCSFVAAGLSFKLRKMPLPICSAQSLLRLHLDTTK